MKHYLTYEEKCILLASISHERKYAKELTNGDKLLMVCDSLDYKFMYDRLFKQIKTDVIDECIKALKGYGECDLADKITLLEQLKEQK